MKILIIGATGGTNVGDSFLRGALLQGLGATLVDMSAAYAGPRPLRLAAWHLLDRRPYRLGEFSEAVVRRVREQRFDVILTTGLAPLNDAALAALGAEGVVRLNFLTDDPWNAAHRARWFLKALPHYDFVFTARRANIADLRAAGCRYVSFLPFAYDEAIFFKESLAPELTERLQSDVFFAGGADHERVPYIEALIAAGLDVRVCGNYWDRYSATRSHWGGFAEPAMVRQGLAATRVGLCLVRRANRDGNSMRSFEVPAAGACALMEDTQEHRDLFGGDGERVVYFRTIPEMVDKARWLIAHPAERARLAEACHRHVVGGANTYRDRLEEMLRIAHEEVRSPIRPAIAQPVRAANGGQLAATPGWRTLAFEAARLTLVRLGKRMVRGTSLPKVVTGSVRVCRSEAPPAPSRRILVVGQLNYATTSWSRLKALEAQFESASRINISPLIEQHGWRNMMVNHLYAGEVVREINRAVRVAAEVDRPDVVWVDKGLHIWPETVEAVRAAGGRLLVHFSPDNQMVLGNQSRHYIASIPLYDVHVTTKRHNLNWLAQCGAQRVEYMGKGYDPDLHRPMVLDDDDRRLYECDVGFVGHWEPTREDLLVRLQRKGYRVKVWGGNWRRAGNGRRAPFGGARHVTGADYAKAMCGTKINLCLLSKWFEDQSTARSVEIPACGAFMLADRTTEHTELFQEGVEAEFYDSEAEMVEKIDYYLANPDKRTRIAAAGRERCLRSYSNDARVRDVFARIKGA